MHIHTYINIYSTCIYIIFINRPTGKEAYMLIYRDFEILQELTSDQTVRHKSYSNSRCEAELGWYSF